MRCSHRPNCHGCCLFQPNAGLEPAGAGPPPAAVRTAQEPWRYSRVSPDQPPKLCPLMPEKFAGVVLLVEDEPLVRLVVVDILMEANFRVIEASNADEALTVLKADVP